MNEALLESTIAKGDRARVVLEEPIIKEFFEATEQSFIDGIKGSTFEDHEGRENLFRMFKVLDAFKKFFERYIAEGKIANDMLQRFREGKFDNL